MEWIGRLLARCKRRKGSIGEPAKEAKRSAPLLKLLDQLSRDPANHEKWLAEAESQGIIKVHRGPVSDLQPTRTRVERQLSMLGPDGHIHAAAIRYDVGVRPPTLEVLNAPIGSGAYSEGDLWWSLMELRKQIEPAGWRVLCNGSRRYVWTNGMAADFTNGESAYLLDRSRGRERRHEIVNIFDPATVETVTDIRGQIAAADEVFGGRLAKTMKSWMTD